MFSVVPFVLISWCKSNIKQYSLSMAILKALKELVYKSDLLSSGSLLRVRGEPDHKTLTGGLTSITLMIVLVAVFANKIIDTLNKIIITSNTNTSNADDPAALNLTALDSGPFMFGVEVWHHNLNEGSRYFDVTLINTLYSYGEPQNTSIQYQLEPCTREHWNGYPEVQAKYDRLDMNYWQCLPKNMSYEIKGKYASIQSKTLDVAVKTCSNNSFDERPCAPQQQIDQFFADGGIQFFTIYFLNPLINPDNDEYLTYYLEDSNYITFSQHGGEEGRLLVEDFQISTDESILPFSNYLLESGGIITQNALKSTYTEITDTYAIFFFYKSPTSKMYDRNFQKLDEVFAYIGGLFGIILIAFFLVSNYNTYKFQINLAGYLYKSEQTEKLQKKYNLLYFCGHMVYMILGWMNIHPKWEKLNRYSQTREEMLKQLDILLLLKRINFLQKSLTFLFTDHQLKVLHLTNQLTMAQAANIRRNYKLKAKLQCQIQSQSKSNPNSNQAEIDFQSNFNDINMSNDIIRKQYEKDEKNQQGGRLDSSPNRKPMAHRFNSQQYSSESQSEDDNETCVLDSVKRLRKQQTENELSHRILKSIDDRLKVIIKPVISKQFKQKAEKKKDSFEQHILQDNESSEHQVNNLFIFQIEDAKSNQFKLGSHQQLQ